MLIHLLEWIEDGHGFGAYMRKVDPQFYGLGLMGYSRVRTSPHLLAMEARLRIHRCQRQSTNRRAAEWYHRTSERRCQTPSSLKCPCCLLNLNASQDRIGPGQSPRHRTGGVHFAGHALDSKGCERKTRHNGCSSLATLRLG